MTDSKISAKSRIWELDAFRGLFIICMIAVHAVVDLQMTGIMREDAPPLIYNIIKNYGGILFILISGICVTLGSRCFKRGAIVFVCGMVITGVTYAMYLIDSSNDVMLIHFGVLHMLGLSMMLYPIFKSLPVWAIAPIGVILIALGYYASTLRSEYFLTIVIGIIPKGYYAADYFPMLPYFGWFLIGSVLGRTIYKKRQSLMPRFPYDSKPVKFFRFCGRHSLWIYMLHQPVVYGIVMLIWYAFYR